MKKNIIIIGIVIMLLAIAGLFLFISEKKTIDTGQKTATETQMTKEVEIKDFAFNPSVLEILVGTTVTWRNQDNVRHTVTSDSGNELNSPLLNKDEEYSHTFETAGTYDYHCTPHPSMKGKVIVI